jgi:hypothetical protein
MSEKAKDNKAEAILIIGGLIVKYGVPGAIKLIQGLKKKDPTIEDIRALGDRVPEPESFFEG